MKTAGYLALFFGLGYFIAGLQEPPLQNIVGALLAALAFFSVTYLFSGR